MTTIARVGGEMARFGPVDGEHGPASPVAAERAAEKLEAIEAREHDRVGNDQTPSPGDDGVSVHTDDGRAALTRARPATTGEVLRQAGMDTAISGHDRSVRDVIASKPALTGNPIADATAAVQHQMDLSAAYSREAAHVGLVGALNLPAGYKSARANDFSVTPDRAEVIAQKLKSDPHRMAVLQAHADRGMETAREMIENGTTKEQLFAARPDLARLYASDPAFHEGFDAYVHAARTSPSDLAAIHARLDEEAIANHRTLATMSFPA